jgi:serine/threonine protein kinase
LNYARLGNLHAYIDTVENGILPIERARMYLRQVAAALDYLASANVAHRDLKQENIILVARDTVQLCDFGWSIRYAKGQKQSTLCGTPLYVPPEMLVTTAYDPKPVDLWALGVLAHELILTESPFDLDDSEWNNCSDTRDDDARFQRRVIFDKLTSFTKWSCPPGNLDPRAMDFIAKLLRKDPKTRMVASDALCHPFLLDQESLDVNQLVCKTPRRGLIRKLQSFIPKKRKSSLRPAGYDRLTFDPDNEGLSWANTYSSGNQSSVKRRRIH